MKTEPHVKQQHAAVVVASFAMIAPALGDQLWRQYPLDVAGGHASQDARNPGGLGWFCEVVDNFNTQSQWTIDTVQFWGGYQSVTPGHTRGFMIRFYANNNGEVGALLRSQDVMAFS